MLFTALERVNSRRLWRQILKHCLANIRVCVCVLFYVDTVLPLMFMRLFYVLFYACLRRSHMLILCLEFVSTLDVFAT